MFRNRQRRGLVSGSRARSHRRAWNLEGLEDRRLLSGASGTGTQEFLDGISHGPFVAANITSTTPGSTTDSFTTTIDWGDGTTSPGHVVGGNGSFSVYAPAHTYAMDGGYLISILIHEAGNAQTNTPAQDYSASDKADVQVGDLFVAGVGSFNENAGSSFGAVVANISDPGPNPSSDYVAMIDWGDETPAQTGIVVGSDGYYSAEGAHTYASPGTYTVTVTISENGFPQTFQAKSQVVVS